MNIKELVKNKFKEELLSQLDYRSKNELFRELIVYLNEDINIYIKSEDEQETKTNKHLISQFIDKYKVVDEEFIKDFIVNNMSCWCLEELKYFVENIDTSAEYYFYNYNMEEFTSIDDLDIEDEDLEELINLILELK